MRSSATMLMAIIFLYMVTNVFAGFWDEFSITLTTATPSRSEPAITATTTAFTKHPDAAALSSWKSSLSELYGTNFDPAPFDSLPTITSYTSVTVAGSTTTTTPTTFASTTMVLAEGAVITSLPDMISTEDQGVADVQLKLMITYILHSLHSLLIELFEVKTSIAWISLLAVPSLLKLVDYVLTSVAKVMWHEYLRRRGQAPVGEVVGGDGANQQGNNAQDLGLDENAIGLEDRAEAARRDGDTAARPDVGGAVNTQNAGPNN